MKKIFALVLAVAMLSTSAFAAASDMDFSDVCVDPATGKGGTAGNEGANPGSIIALDLDMMKSGVSDLSMLKNTYDVSEYNFAVSSRKFKKGANLVKEVKINDDTSEIQIVLNDDINLNRPKIDTSAAPNLVIDAISVKAKKELDTSTGKIARNAVFGLSIGTVATESMGIKVGYSVFTDKLDAPTGYSNGDIVKFVAAGDYKYNTVDMSVGDFFIEGRVYDGDKIYTKVDNKVDVAVLKANPDADLQFYNFKTSGLSANNKVQLLVSEDLFIYENIDGKLTKSSLKWIDDDYAWTGKINGNKSYVISDIELVSAPTAEKPVDPANPETGANDVVGVAAALAVVSLVAAGAVSLKK